MLQTAVMTECRRECMACDTDNVRARQVWSTDNGSPVTVAGTNQPLKGGKGSNWEGAARARAVEPLCDP
jgi:hypothetical protein